MARRRTGPEIFVVREAMLGHAEELLAQGQALNMRILAAKPGVSSMTPYGCFAQKAELLAILRSRGFARPSAAVHDAVASAPNADLRGLAKAYADFAYAHRALFVLMFEGDAGTLGEADDLLRWFETAAAELLASAPIVGFGAG